MPVYPGAHNRRRLHSMLGYRSPDEAERDHRQATLTLWPDTPAGAPRAGT
jgi:hypothetical protein